MEKDAIPVAPIGANTKPVTGLRWKRNLIELNGKSDRNYAHKVSPLLMESYAEIGAFPHEYHRWQSPCRTHIVQSYSASMLRMLYSRSVPDARSFQAAFPSFHGSLYHLGVSALEFDTKGNYLASVTRPGCLTVHKFESLYSHSNESDQEKDQKEQLRHISLFGDSIYDRIRAIRWNPVDQDEIAYTTPSEGALPIFNIEYSQVSQLLSKRSPASLALCDIAFFNDATRVLASDISGEISMWDRRASLFPQRVLTIKKNISLTSIQLLADQCVYGASMSGFIYIWDLRRLRGGSSSTAFQRNKEVHSSPLTSIDLNSMLNETGRLKAQGYIRSKDIQSININPSCSYQLGFHLADGLSGVLDMHNFRVSHIHCPPPPPWLDPRNREFPMSPPRKPSWLPEHSIYAAASTCSNGLHLLDFYPHSSSPCHVDYDDSKSPRESVERKQSVFVPLSKRVSACAAHPLNDTIVAGTMNASLLVVSQKHLCKKGDGDGDGDGDTDGDTDGDSDSDGDSDEQS